MMNGSRSRCRGGYDCRRRRCRPSPRIGGKGIHPIDEEYAGDVQTIGSDGVGHVGIAQRRMLRAGIATAIVGVRGGGGAGQPLEVAEMRCDGTGRRPEGQLDGLAAAEGHGR